MIAGKRVLALVPARGGSKGIKDKNIVLLNSKPMIGYTLEACNKSKYIDYTVVSTDSSKIAEIASHFGGEVPFFRPEELAGDKSKTIDCVLYTIDRLRVEGQLFDILILLQPTSPLRSCENIDEALELFVEKGEHSVVSVSRVQSEPILIRSIDNEKRLQSLLGQNSTCRRQDMPEYYCVNGSIYINKVDELNHDSSFNDNEYGYIMDETNSVDIDTMFDLKVAEMRLIAKEKE